MPSSITPIARHLELSESWRLSKNTQLMVRMPFPRYVLSYLNALLIPHTTESAFDPNHPYYDPKASRDSPKWVVVHVEFRRKLQNPVTLNDLKAHAEAGKPLEDLQTLKQSRLSVSSVTPAQWHYILQLAGDDSKDFAKTESKDDDEDMDAENEEDDESEE